MEQSLPLSRRRDRDPTRKAILMPPSAARDPAVWVSALIESSTNLFIARPAPVPRLSLRLITGFPVTTLALELHQRPSAGSLAIRRGAGTRVHVRPLHTTVLEYRNGPVLYEIALAAAWTLRKPCCWRAPFVADQSRTWIRSQCPNPLKRWGGGVELRIWWQEASMHRLRLRCCRP